MEGLVAHAGTSIIDRATLAGLITPPGTDTHKPIPHIEVVSQLEEALAFRHIQVTAEEFAVSADGNWLFGCLSISATYEAVRFALGIRNSHDKSMLLGMVAGYRVFVCDNMAFAGDFKPLLAKPTKNFDLQDALSVGVDRIQRNWEPLREAIDLKRRSRLSDIHARSMIYQAFMEKRFPVKLMRRVHQDFFGLQSPDEPPTVWKLENAFTSAFKHLAPLKQYVMTARLGTFITSLN